MSVQSEILKISHTLVSETDAIPYNQRFLDRSHLKVLRNADNGSGIPIDPATELVLDTDYTVTGDGDPTGGTVFIINTAASTTGDIITISNTQVPFTQLVNYIYNAAFPSETHEQALDQLTFLNQIVNEIAGRAIKYPESELAGFIDTLPDKESRKGKVISFNSSTGEMEVTSEIGGWLGDWANDTLYNVRDFVYDPITGKIFICVTQHTSASSGNHPGDNSDWDLVFDGSGSLGDQTGRTLFTAGVKTQQITFSPTFATQPSFRYSLENGSGSPFLPSHEFKFDQTSTPWSSVTITVHANAPTNFYINWEASL